MLEATEQNNPRRTEHSFWRRSRKLELPDDPFEHAALPGYGTIYLNHLIGEFASLRKYSSDEELLALGDGIVSKAQQGKMMTWGDTYLLDDVIIQMLPSEYLRQRAWCVEVRYRDAVGNADAFDAFIKSERSRLVDESEEHLRARVHNMVGELYRLYTVGTCREALKEKLAGEARFTLFIILGAVVLFSVVGSTLRVAEFVDIWGLVFAVGATGGLVSLQRRLQAISNRGESLGDLVELSSGMTIKLTPVLGGIFSIVLLAIFCSGFVSGELFPNIVAKTEVNDFVSFARQVHPAQINDWGKLLVWSFIAGFAERFVPDTLDRLIARADQNKSKA